MFSTKVIAILTVTLLIAGSIAKFGHSQYEAGLTKAKLEYEEVLNEKMIQVEKRQRIEHANAIALDNALTYMEEKLESNTAEIIHVVKTLDCKTLSDEFVELFNSYVEHPDL